ncbi:unnamed protein product [Pleuronectes platessa]|uniref:Uncharacterized protein n=1 Tax=Pleuronectes platessa TaxID=8262 RepID=A0A9N7U6A0_PLEPL|nr:unnamed protein product [Pleuronectes platessa]
MAGCIQTLIREGADKQEHRSYQLRHRSVCATAAFRSLPGQPGKASVSLDFFSPQAIVTESSDLQTSNFIQGRLSVTRAADEARGPLLNGPGSEANALSYLIECRAPWLFRED